MKRLRVLHFIASSHGGGAAQVRDLALGLPPSRFEVFVAMPDGGGNVTPADFAGSGVQFLRCPAIRRLSPIQVAGFRRLLRRHDIDILHVHGARAASCGRLAAALLRRRPRVVYTVHGFAAPFYPSAKRLPYLWLERRLQAVTDVTVCVAQTEADSLRSAHVGDAETLRVVRCGIDVDRFAPDATAMPALRDALRLGPGPIVLTASRLDVPRDFDSLLDAFHRLHLQVPAARLLIAGDGPQRRQIAERREALGLGDAVRMLGFQRQMAPLLALADAFVLTTSGWEGLPVSVLEAQAAGVPVVATDAGGSREALADGESGFLTPARDPAALSESLLTLLHSRDVRRRFGDAGRARVRAGFSSRRMVQETIDVYTGLA